MQNNSTSNCQNPDWRIIKTYALEDLFSPLNRKGTIFTVILIFFLVWITSALIVFGGSLRSYTVEKLSNPFINRLKVTPNYSQGRQGLDEKEFEAMATLHWTDHPKEGESVYPIKAISENGWKLLGPAVVGARGRHVLSLTLGNRLNLRQVTLVTLEPDDPILEKMGFKGALDDEETPSMLIKRNALSTLGFEDRAPETIRPKDFKQKQFKVIVDEKNILPSPAIMSEEWYRNYWSQYNTGNPYPPFQYAEVYPRSLVDVIEIAEALDRLGHKFDRNFYFKVKNGMDNINFVGWFVTILCVILLVIVGISQLFHFLYSFEKKKKEFGFMMASGIPICVLRRIFFMEGVIICCVGTALGIGALYASIPPISWVLHNLLDLKGLTYSPSIVVNWLVFSIAVIFGTVLTPSILAVHRNFKQRPAELMRT